MIRPKPFLTYFISCAIPLLLLAGLNYWNGIRTVDATLNTIVQNDLNSFNASVDELLSLKGNTILRLARSRNVQRAVSNTMNSNASSPLDLDRHFLSLTLIARDRRVVSFRSGDTEWNAWDANAENTRPATFPHPDPRVWGLTGSALLDRSVDGSSTTFENTTAVFDETNTNNLGALIGIIDLESVFSTTARALESRSANGNGPGSMVVVLDRAGKVVYHSDRNLKLKPASEALPGFDSISKAMAANESGLGEFRAAGSYYVAAYSPMPRLNVALAVARNRSDFTFDAHFWGVAGLLLALFAASAAAVLLERHVQGRSRGMERVTEDLSAIAKGELDRRIILQSSDDARGLADNINVVTERLRAQIAREEESRQFESFVRLSAMLTHDLKNAIEGLSLTVGNMERHFDNPQFRSDALRGLTSATDKLKAIVARLARPLTSLSGEHRRPTNIDLVPILQRVVTLTAEPLRSKHTIVMRLPQSLFALCDPARIEEVIENMVLNALEAMVQPGGTLTVEAGQTANGAPTFSISDTGRGMSRMFIEHRLFRPFSTTKKTGIGLGLYTCREVIQASAGSIEVDSVEGAGTTFRVVLPSIPHDRRN
jgi:signal transduction histidine kinase